MRKRSSKKTRLPDPNVVAFSIVQKLSGEDAASSKSTTKQGKNQKAAKSGKLGGPARAKKLSAARRAEIARNAAKARWKSKKS